MSFSIRSNSASLAAQTNLSSTSDSLTKTMNQLSSGDRLIDAGTDATGLGMSRNLEAQIASYSQAGRNAKDGVSMAQTAAGYLSTVQDQLSRLRTLAMQGQTGAAGTESAAIVAEFNRTSSTAEYNGQKLFETASGVGGPQSSVTIGIRGAAGDSILIDMSAMKLDATSLLGNPTGFTVGNIDTAIGSVSGYVTSLGSTMNRLDAIGSTIGKAVKNLSDADERIRDTDVTAAAAQLARQSVLAQAGVSVMAQANQLPQMALKLLG